uniref:Uncharacterized protein n=1 Tax=Mycena chlorophos TaxID=658473 RepID=A0ABQ0M766_MYCCL|nr:predicted protein [Mycena chlorophos]
MIHRPEPSVRESGSSRNTAVVAADRRGVYSVAWFKPESPPYQIRDVSIVLPSRCFPGTPASLSAHVFLETAFGNLDGGQAEPKTL